jgi:hypothetical protein
MNTINIDYKFCKQLLLISKQIFYMRLLFSRTSRHILAIQRATKYFEIAEPRYTR